MLKERVEAEVALNTIGKIPNIHNHYHCAPFPSRQTRSGDVRSRVAAEAKITRIGTVTSLLTALEPRQAGCIHFFTWTVLPMTISPSTPLTNTLISTTVLHGALGILVLQSSLDESAASR